MNDQLKTLIARLHHDESGAAATEYIILLVCVASFLIAAVKLFGNTASSKFDAGETAVAKQVTFN